MALISIEGQLLCRIWSSILCERVKIELISMNSIQLIDSPQNDQKMSRVWYLISQSLQRPTPTLKLASMSIIVTPELPESRLGDEANLNFAQMSCWAGVLFSPGMFCPSSFSCLGGLNWICVSGTQISQLSVYWERTSSFFPISLWFSTANNFILGVTGSRWHHPPSRK